MSTVYVETSVMSYLAAKPSRDLVTAAHQQVTRDWWETARDRFALHISELVLAEISAGNPGLASKRLELVADLPILQYSDDVASLVAEFQTRLELTGRARADLPHFAFAVSYEIDYLVTWNCAHIANGEVIRRLMQATNELQRFCPAILTPNELKENIGGGIP
jgi:predicted nucleic acid-binding protein